MAKITDKVKSFEDACNVLNILPSLPDLAAIPEEMRKPLIAMYKLMIIAKALNEGWIPNWTNGKWDKWFPWFDFNTDNEVSSSSSGRFSFYYSDNQRSASDCGSRLCYKSEVLADYAGKQFEELYREAYVID